MSELKSSLEQASAVGDITRVKSLNEQISLLRRSGVRILALEKEKVEAVRVEDFDTAKQIKMKIEELRRTQVLREPESSIASGAPATVLPYFGAESPSEILPAADPLPAYFARDYPQVLESLGDEILSLLLSRDWRLRETGLDRLISRIRTDRNTDSIDWALRRFAVEKIVSVMIKLCELLQVAVSVNAETSGEAVEFVVIHLVEHRLVSSNRRLVDSVISALVAVAQSGSSGSHLVQHYLLKSPASVSAIPSRCLCLISLIDAIKFTGKGAVNLDQLVPSLAEWLPRAVSSETRNSILQVLADTVAHVGPARAEIAILAVPNPDREALRTELHRLATRRPPSPARGSAAAIACDFCGKKSERFSIEEELDLHFWEDCAALIECSFCEQVVELTSLTEHRLKECDNVAACGIDV